MASNTVTQSHQQLFGDSDAPRRFDAMENASARSLGSFSTPLTSPAGDVAAIGAVDFLPSAVMAATTARASQSSRTSQGLLRTASSGSMTRPLSRRNSASSLGAGGVRVPALKPLDWAPVPFAESAEAQAALSARSRRASVASTGAGRATQAGGSVAHTPLEPTFSFFSQAGADRGEGMPDLRPAHIGSGVEPALGSAPAAPTPDPAFMPTLALGQGLGLQGMKAPLSTLTSGSVTSFNEQDDFHAPAALSSVQPTSMGSLPRAGPPPSYAPHFGPPPPTATAGAGPPPSSTLGAPLAAAPPAFANPALRAKGKGKPAPAYATYVPSTHVPAAPFAVPPTGAGTATMGAGLGATDTGLTPDQPVDAAPQPSVLSSRLLPDLPSSVAPPAWSDPLGSVSRVDERQEQDTPPTHIPEHVVRPFIPRRSSSDQGSGGSTGRRTPPVSAGADGATAGVVMGSSVGNSSGSGAAQAVVTAPTSALFRDTGGTGEAFFSKPAPRPQYQRVRAATTGTAAPAHSLFGLSAPSAPPVPSLPPTVPRVAATTKEVAAPAQLFKAKDVTGDGTAAQLVAMGLSLKPALSGRPRLGSQGGGQVGATTASLFANVPDSGTGSDYFSNSGLSSFKTAAGGISSTAADADAFFGTAGGEGGGGSMSHEGRTQQQMDSNAFEHGHEGSIYTNDMTVEEAARLDHEGSPHVPPVDGQDAGQVGQAEIRYEGPVHAWAPSAALPWQSSSSSGSHSSAPWQVPGHGPATTMRAPSPSSSTASQPLSAGVGPAKGRIVALFAGPTLPPSQSAASSKPVGFDPSSWSSSSAAQHTAPSMHPSLTEPAKPQSGPLPASALLAAAPSGPPAAPFPPGGDSSVPWATASSSSGDGSVAAGGKKRTGQPRPQFAVFQPAFAASVSESALHAPAEVLADVSAARVGAGMNVAAQEVVSPTLQPTLRGSRERTDWERSLAAAVADQGGPLVTASQASAGLGIVHARLASVFEGDMQEYMAQGAGAEGSEEQLAVRADVELLHGVLIALIEQGGSSSTVHIIETVLGVACSLLRSQAVGPSDRVDTPAEVMTEGERGVLHAEQVEALHAQMLVGSKAAALDAAISGRHWGHAFLLAGCTGGGDKAAHARVLQAFAHSICPPARAHSPLAYLCKAMTGDIAGVRADLGLGVSSDPSTGLLHPHHGRQWRAVLASLWSNGYLTDKQSMSDIASRMGAVMPTCHAAHAVRLLAGASLRALPSAPVTVGSPSTLTGPTIDLQVVGSTVRNDGPAAEVMHLSLPALLRSELLEYAVKSCSKSSTLPLAQPLKLATAQALWDCGQEQAAAQYLAAAKAGVEESLGVDYALHEKSVKYAGDGTACIGPFPLSFLLELEDTEVSMAAAGQGRRRTSPQVRAALVAMLAGPPKKPKVATSSLSSMFGSSASAGPVSSGALPSAASASSASSAAAVVAPGKAAEYVPHAAPAAATRTVRASSLFGGVPSEPGPMLHPPTTAGEAPRTPSRREESAERAVQAQQSTPALQASTGGGLFSGIRSMFRGRRGAPGGESAAPSGPRVVKLEEPGGQGSKPYYDDKLGRWVFPGETEEESAPPPPPPVMAAAPAPAGGDSAAPAIPQFSATARAGGKANRINRYVAPVPTTATAAGSVGEVSVSSSLAGLAPAMVAPAKVKYAVFAPPPAPAPGPLEAEPVPALQAPMEPTLPAAAPQRASTASASTWQPTATPSPAMELADLSTDGPPAPPVSAFGAETAEDAMAFFGSAWDEPAVGTAAPPAVPVSSMPIGAPTHAPAQPAPWAQASSTTAGTGTGHQGVPPTGLQPAVAQPWAVGGASSAGAGLAASARLAPAAGKDDGSDWF